MFDNNHFENNLLTEDLNGNLAQFNNKGLSADYLLKLASSIFIASRLPDNNDYVKFFGNGSEKSNREAIASFVMSKLDSFNENEIEDHLSIGIALLKEKFQEIEDEFKYE